MGDISPKDLLILIYFFSLKSWLSPSPPSLGVPFSVVLGIPFTCLALKLNPAVTLFPGFLSHF